MKSAHQLRRHLLAGASALFLGTLIAPSVALAQTSEIDALARQAVITNQRSEASIIATDTNPPVSAHVDVLTDGKAEISANTLAVAARGNDADVAIDAPGDGPAMSARTVIAGRAVDAHADTLLATRQLLRSAAVAADVARSDTSITGGVAQRAVISMRDNDGTASATGNGHVARISNATGSGTGVISAQFADTASSVSSVFAGSVGAAINAGIDSTFTLTGNRQQALASGNAADLALQAYGPSIDGDSLGGSIDAATGRVTASAASLVLAQQEWSGPAVSSLGSPAASAGTRMVVATLDRSNVAVDGNVVRAGTAANQTTIEHVTDTASVTGSGTAALNLTYQTEAGLVRALAAGGAKAHATDDISASRLSASSNLVTATAAGNLSDTNLRADMSIAGTAGETGGSNPGYSMIAPDMSQIAATFAALTDQHVGDTSIAATVSDGATEIGIDGTISGSTVAAISNRQTAEAVANDAASRIDISATTLAGSVAAGLAQSSDADVGAYVGTEDRVGGATIAPLGSIQDSRLDIQDNLIQGRATGNRGSNAVTVIAAVVPGQSLGGTEAGSVDDAFGARAPVALSSAQKLGQLGVSPILTTDLIGRFSITGDGPISRSALTISGNRQDALTTGNVIDNALTVTAARSSGGTAAIASSQYGDAAVRSTSTMRLVDRSGITDSVSSITDNVNRSEAVMNDAVNLLHTEAPTGSFASLTTDSLGGADADGGDVIANMQFSTGTVASNAKTVMGGSAGSQDLGVTGMLDSRFDVTGNATASLATANRASNTAELNGSGGIASSQMNVAGVSATASAVTRLGLLAPGYSLDGSTLPIEESSADAVARGNTAENSVTLNPLNMTDAPVMAVAGRFPTSVLAPAGIASMQSNYGPVTATVASAIGSPLNGTLVASESKISVGGNQTSATAFANEVTNRITASTGTGVALASSQYNSGAVTAQVTSSLVGVNIANASRTSLDFSGNRVSASAVGNLATNVIASPR